MRKAIIEFEFKESIKKIIDWNKILKNIISFEVIEILKIDIEKAMKLLIIKITMKEGYNVEDIDLPEGGEILSVLKSEGNQHICLVRGQMPTDKFKAFKKILPKLDLNLIYTTPTLFNLDKMVISIIGEEGEIKKFYESWKEIADIKQISFQQADFQWHSVLSCLTEKQKDIVIHAKKFGYYEYPRKIDSYKLSQIMGLSKSTTIEHLRKAESRIIKNILVGY